MPTSQDENLKAMAEKLGQGFNETTGQLIDPNKGYLEQLPTGNQAQRDANVTTRANAIASSLGQTYNVDTQQYEAGPTALEIQRNKEQAAFNAANPVGTKVEDIKYTPTDKIQPSTVPTAPVSTTSGTNTPVDVTTPVKTQINGVSSEPLINGKTQAEWDSSKGREAEITSNLTTITQQTPTLLSDRNQYDKAFGYATADENKKALLDSFFINGKKTIDSLNTIKQWSGSSVDDLSAALIDGSISPSVKNSLMSDAALSAKIAKAEALNKINGKKTNIADVALKQTAEVLASRPTIAKALEDGEFTQEEITALTSSPEQIALQKKKDLEFEELNKKQAIWDSIEDDINKKTSGGGYTASDKAQMVANARKVLLPELNRAERAYNNTIAQLTEMKKDALGILETNLGMYKESKAQENALALDQAKFEQQLKQQARLASDPYTAISSVMDEYKKLGIPFTQSIATKVADANKFIASGGTIGGYVDKMIKDIQAKPEYNAIQQKKLFEQYKPFSVGKDSVVYDPTTKSFVYQSSASQSGTTTGNVTVTSGTSRNRPDRNNNPGNVKIGDVGYGVDDQNHTIFGDAQTGYAAMVKDLTAKLTGGSSQKSRLTGKILSPSSTLADLGSVYAEDPKWAQSVARLSGYPTNTQLSQIDVNVLAPAIAKQEGFTGNISTKQEDSIIDEASGAPLTYARRIKSMVPVQLQNSDLEAKNLNNVISTLYKKGVSPEDAILSYMGVEFKPEKKEIGLRMIDAIKGSDVQPSVYTAIADKLNSGNDSGAVQTLENALYATKGIKTSDIADIGTNVKNGNKLLERINTLKNKFGPISGKLEQWGQTIQNDKETQRLLSDMTNFVAKYRNGIAGTSVTSNEEDFLKNIIPTLTNNPDNAIAKIESNIGQAFNGLNTIRDQVGLPVLQDSRSSYDINFRKQAFTGRGGLDVKTPTTIANKYNIDYAALAKILTQ